MFHTVVQQGFFYRNGKEYYTYFIDNSFLFPTVKEFSKSVNTFTAKSLAPYILDSVHIILCLCGTTKCVSMFGPNNNKWWWWVWRTTACRWIHTTNRNLFLFFASEINSEFS